MGILIVTALAVGLFALLVAGVSKSDRATVEQLERNGRLCLGTVLSYDGDDLAEIEFIPVGGAVPIKALGLGSFLKKQFPPGSQVAVWYNPLCPSVNRVVPERTNDAHQQVRCHMKNICSTCGRENSAEAFQCPACRPRSLGSNDPSRDYRLNQQALGRKRKETLLAQAIHAHREFPGAQHKGTIAVCSIALMALGAAGWQSPFARAALILGLILFGWLMLTVRVHQWREQLERQQSRPEDQDDA